MLLFPTDRCSEKGPLWIPARKDNSLARRIASKRNIYLGHQLRRVLTGSVLCSALDQFKVAIKGTKKLDRDFEFESHGYDEYVC